MSVVNTQSLIPSVHVATHTQPQTNPVCVHPFCKFPFHHLCERETNDIWRDWMFPWSLHHLGKSEGSLFYLLNTLHLPCSNIMAQYVYHLECRVDSKHFLC